MRRSFVEDRWEAAAENLVPIELGRVTELGRIGESRVGV